VVALLVVDVQEHENWRARQVAQHLSTQRLVVLVVDVRDNAADVPSLGKDGVREDRPVKDHALASCADMADRLNVRPEALAEQPELHLESKAGGITVEVREIGVGLYRLKEHAVPEHLAKAPAQGRLPRTDVTFDNNDPHHCFVSS
jgi:hypothetical protein